MKIQLISITKVKSSYIVVEPLFIALKFKFSILTVKSVVARDTDEKKKQMTVLIQWHL